MAGVGMGAVKRLAEGIIAGEPLLLLAAVPLLIFPQGYLWQWQQGVFHYAPIEDSALRYPGLLSWIGLGLAALPWLSRWIRWGRPTRPTALDIPIAVYLGTAALSLWPSVDRAHSLSFLLVLVAGLALYYGVVNGVSNRARLGWATVGFMAGGVALATLGLFQTDWSVLANDVPVVGPWLESLPHPLGRTINRGVTAGVSVLFVPVGVSLTLTARQRPLRLLAGVATAWIALFLFLSQSRGDILALALTVPALLLWHMRRGHLWVAGLALGLTGLLAGTTLYAPNLVAQIQHVYPSRWQVWERAAYIIRDHPFTGIGLDTFRHVAQNLYPYVDPGLNQTPMVHNRLLQVGVDQGLLGVAAFTVLVILYYVANRRAWRAAGDSSQRGLAVGFVAGFTALVIGSVPDDGVWTGRAGLAVWYLLGLGMAQARLLAGVESLASAVEGRGPIWLRRRGAWAWLLVSGVLVLALVALLLAPAVWHNLGNVVRNRGWLAVEPLPGERAQAHAATTAAYTLTAYQHAGAAAARDRGALILLAHHPWPGNADSAFLAAVAAETEDAAALADLEAAVAGPYDRFAHLYLAEAYRVAGRLESAAAEYKQAGFPVGWILDQARKRWDWGRGDAEAAIGRLTIAMLMDGEAAEALYVLGLVYEQQGDKERATEAYLRSAGLYKDHGVVAQAREVYQRLLRMDPENTRVQIELTNLPEMNR